MSILSGVHINRSHCTSYQPKITFITFAAVAEITDTFYYIGMDFFLRRIIVLVSKHYCTIIISFMLHHSVTFEPDTLQLPAVTTRIFYSPNGTGNQYAIFCCNEIYFDKILKSL